MYANFTEASGNYNHVLCRVLQPFSFMKCDRINILLLFVANKFTRTFPKVNVRSTSDREIERKICSAKSESVSRCDARTAFWFYRQNVFSTLRLQNPVEVEMFSDAVS